MAGLELTKETGQRVRWAQDTRVLEGERDGLGARRRTAARRQAQEDAGQTQDSDSVQDRDGSTPFAMICSML